METRFKVRNHFYIMALFVACGLLTGCFGQITKASLNTLDDYVDTNIQNTKSDFENGRITEGQKKVRDAKHTEAKEVIANLKQEAAK